MWLLLFQDRTAAFFASVLTGAFVGLIYDFFRIGRAIYKGGRVKLFLEDLLFSVMAALVFAVFMFNATMGVVRMFAAAGALFGFFAYRFSIGLLTVPAARALKALLVPPLKRASAALSDLRDAVSARLFTKAQALKAARLARRGFARC